jgi:triacylglycerol lipase
VRVRGEYTLAFQHLIYPMIDDRTCVTWSPNPYAGEFIWSPESNRFGWKSLLGFEPGGEGVSPYAAAARATDLAGLPPTYISVGALDLFIDENLEFARRLIRAGVPTELHVYPGAYHGFDLDPTPRVSQTSGQNSVAALARALAKPQAET